MHRHNIYSDWSRHLFADAAVVAGSTRTIYLAGMAAEDPCDGHVHYPGDCVAQTRMAYEKITKLLAAEGAGLGDIVRAVTYLTDIRDKEVYENEQQRALTGISPPPHTIVEVTGLAWPGMVVEIDITAVVEARERGDATEKPVP